MVYGATIWQRRVNFRVFTSFQYSQRAPTQCLDRYWYRQWSLNFPCRKKPISYEILEHRGKMRFGGLGGFWVIFVVNIIKRIAQKLRRIILLHFGTSNFSISFWENSQTHHFHDFGICGRVYDSQNQLLCFGRHQDTPNSSNNPTILKLLFLQISTTTLTSMIFCFGNYGRRTS